jgi:hypothetical protein
VAVELTICMPLFPLSALSCAADSTAAGTRRGQLLGRRLPAVCPQEPVPFLLSPRDPGQRFLKAYRLAVL